MGKLPFITDFSLKNDRSSCSVKIMKSVDTQKKNSEVHTVEQPDFQKMTKKNSEIHTVEQPRLSENDKKEQ